MKTDVRRVINSKELDACYMVRMSVFVDEQKVPPWEEMMRMMNARITLPVFRNSEMSGTARIVDTGETNPEKKAAWRIKGSRNLVSGVRLMQHVIGKDLTNIRRLLLDAHCR